MEEIDRFDAEDDDGNVYTVVEWRKANSFPSLKGGVRVRGGSIQYRLSDGRSVFATDDPMAFEISGTDKIIRKVD